MKRMSFIYGQKIEYNIRERLKILHISYNYFRPFKYEVYNYQRVQEQREFRADS